MAHEPYEVVGDVLLALGVQHVEVGDDVSVDYVALHELAIRVSARDAEPLRHVLNAEHRKEQLVGVGDGLVWVIVVHAISILRPAFPIVSVWRYEGLRRKDQLHRKGLAVLKRSLSIYEERHFGMRN